MENLLFKDLEVSKEVLKGIEQMGFEELTPVQSQAILPMLEGLDLIAQAPTGTGKTCAFGIPLIEKIDVRNENIQILILCPTRELVIQTAEELKNVAAFKKTSGSGLECVISLPSATASNSPVNSVFCKISFAFLLEEPTASFTPAQRNCCNVCRTGAGTSCGAIVCSSAR